MVPSRFVAVDAARGRWGGRVDRLMSWSMVADPPADAAYAALAALPRTEARRVLDLAIASPVGAAESIPAVAALLVPLAEPPVWFDRARAARGGRMFLETGVAGGLVLGAASLVTGYLAPGGNKPLIASGVLLRSGASRRLAETSAFVRDVCRPGGMDRDGPGFAATVRVRMMHAAVRSRLRAGPVALPGARWQDEAWGAPLNQHDLAATVLLFGWVAVEGLRRLGIHPSESDVRDFLHLWRGVGQVIGVEPELVSDDPDACKTLSAMVRAIQAPPDDDARALVGALLDASTPGLPPDSPERRRARQFGASLVRLFHGDAIADALALPRSPVDRLVPHLAGVVSPASRALWRSRRIRDRLFVEGLRYWDEAVAQGLGSASPAYAWG
jgi:hypothetical protein